MIKLGLEWLEYFLQMVKSLFLCLTSFLLNDKRTFPYKNNQENLNYIFQITERSRDTGGNNNGVIMLARNRSAQTIMWSMQVILKLLHLQPYLC